MKIVLTGATGFVGSEVLSHLIDSPAVDHVSALVRRPVATGSDKVDSIVLDDFTHYPEDLLAQLSDHSACIWTLGGKDSDTADPELYTKITHGFALAFASAIAPRSAEFTFCYLSGAGADPTETTRFPWEKLTRHIKGRTEKDLQRLAAIHPAFSVHCFRPAGILPVATNPVLGALAAPISVPVDQLADALVTVATTAGPDVPTVISNSAIKRIAAHTASLR